MTKGKLFPQTILGAAACLLAPLQQEKRMKLKLQFIMAAFFVLVIYIPAAHGQARLTFSGGSNTPLTTTVQTQISYTITNSNCVGNLSIDFVFDEVGNLPLSSNSTGTSRFSINGGTSQPLNFIQSGTTSGNGITLYDISTGGLPPGGSMGDTVVLSAGTITSTRNFSAAPPASGSFRTFLTNGNGAICSGDGLVPTAAAVSVSGRVTTFTGRGILNVRLSLIDSSGQIRTAMTTAFGYYRFVDVQAGETYILTATGKRYTFSQPV